MFKNSRDTRELGREVELEVRKEGENQPAVDDFQAADGSFGPLWYSKDGMPYHAVFKSGCEDAVASQRADSIF
jgi:hypothetical protein